MYLRNVFIPRANIPSVPRLVKYFSFPYLGFKTKCVEKELSNILSKFYPFMNCKLIFCNPIRINSLFKFKDSLPPLARSKVVYLFTCPKCDLGRYVGSTIRLLKVRVDGHRGVSHRTQSNLNVKENSSIREHCLSKCRHNILYNDFKIIHTSNNKSDLLIAESLMIKSLNPELNNDLASVPLLIA